MNIPECLGGGGQKVGKHFKGIENFLKRVAFNLGNSPSQTEVKIISCIPIDVTDLQQKIICLEKQLEDARCFRTDQKRVVNTAVCDIQGTLTSNTGVSCNMTEIDRSANPHERNKKPPGGIDRNNLKERLSISCIPSSTLRESSDLQTTDIPLTSYQHLPRQDKSTWYENDKKPFTVGDSNPREDRTRFFKKKKKILNTKKPKSHCVYYAQTNTSPFNKLGKNVPRKKNVVTRSYLEKIINRQYSPRPLGGNLSEISKFSSPICKDTQDASAIRAYESDICSCCHGPFHNIDNRMPKNNNVFRPNQRITDGGYYDSTLYDVIPVKERPVKIKKAVDMPRKRDPKPLYDINCWPEDVQTKLCTYPIYHPMYLNYHTPLPSPNMYSKPSPKMLRRQKIVRQNVKRRMAVDKQIDIETSKSCSINLGSVYPKVINKRPQTNVCLETTFTPRKINAECLTNFILNSECQTTTGTCSPEITQTDNKTEETLNQIKTILQSVLQEVKVTALNKVNTGCKPKRDAVVQKDESNGNITCLQHNIPNNLPSNLQGHMPQSSLHNNITDINIERSYPIGITASTHGNLMGSFLGFKPTSTQDNMSSSLPDALPTNMNNCRLLNNTYSHNNINPYRPSCSNASQAYYPGLKYFHNFPLFLQSPGQPVCSYYRHSSQFKTAHMKHATTIATNTDTVTEEHSKETEKLIKEIYKSMALNMGVVHKDNSSSEYVPVHDFTSQMIKPTKRDLEKSVSIKEGNKVTSVVQAVSELFRKKDMQISTETPDTTTHTPDTESRLVTNEVSTRSQLVTTSTEPDVKFRKRRLDKFINQTKHGRPDFVNQEKRHVQATITRNAVTAISNPNTSSDSDTSNTFVPHQSKQVAQKEKKEKKSLFSKMINSVKLFKPRETKRRVIKNENKVETHEIEDTSSDSDDYQTIYSQKVDTANKHKPRVHNLPKRRTHSKISYKQAYQRERSPDKLVKRSPAPYLEQEYRRQWNEKLTFHDNRHRTSEYPYSGDSPSRKTQRSVESPRRTTPYYQTYEARSVCVDPRSNTVYRGQPVNAKRVLVKKQENSSSTRMPSKLGSKGMAWLKEHKMGIRCGEQWKKFILES